jgi:hypothetical protein
LKRALALFLVLALLPLAGCGSSNDGSAFDEWDGTSMIGTGPLEISEFNEFLAENPQFAWAPTVAAALFLRLDRATGTETIVVSRAGESPSPVTVAVILDRLADDSVRARRYVLGFELAAASEWRLTSAVATQRCHPGRGHQDFSAELCV